MDELLGRSYCVATTEFFGEFGSKTQICFQLAVNATSLRDGRFRFGVVIIDTENTFRRCQCPDVELSGHDPSRF